jgi:hypothetical protein
MGFPPPLLVRECTQRCFGTNDHAPPPRPDSADRTAAEAANLGYYVQTNIEGDSLAYTFLPSAIESAIAAKGGLSALEQRVYAGVATSDDMTVFNAYSQANQNSQDPRYALTPLVPSGFDFVLIETIAQNNAPTTNALATKTLSDFNILRAQLPAFYTERKVYTLAAANTAYGNRVHLIASAKSYGSLADAQNDISGTTVTPAAGATPFSVATHFAVYEYTYPSTTDLGQIGYESKIIRILSKDQTSLLGRVNPIYQYSQMPARLVQKRLSPLTLIGDPQPLLTFTVGGTSGAFTALNPALIFDTI